MASSAFNYAKVLYEMSVSTDSIAKAQAIFKDNPVLTKTLSSPVLQIEKKYNIVDKIFSDDIKNFIKEICKNDRVDIILDIFNEYTKLYNKENKILNATIYYVTKPTENQQNRIVSFLKKKQNAETVNLSLVHKPELIGGFILYTDGYEYDRSFKSKLDALNRKLVWR